MVCEVLIHHVDLRAGFTPDDRPAGFVTHQLGVVVAAFAAREGSPAMRLHATDTGTSYAVSAIDDAAVIRGPQAHLLAWLMGRSSGTSLTTDSGTALPDL